MTSLLRRPRLGGWPDGPFQAALKHRSGCAQCGHLVRCGELTSEAQVTHIARNGGIGWSTMVSGLIVLIVFYLFWLHADPHP